MSLKILVLFFGKRRFMLRLRWQNFADDGEGNDQKEDDRKRNNKKNTLNTNADLVMPSCRPRSPSLCLTKTAFGPSWSPKSSLSWVPSMRYSPTWPQGLDNLIISGIAGEKSKFTNSRWAMHNFILPAATPSLILILTKHIFNLNNKYKLFSII